MRTAILDIGTNTVLLLVVETVGEQLRILRDDHAIARLGEGVDRTKVISEEAYSRFREVIRKHRATIRALRVEQVVAVGTSALRDAKNRDEIVHRAKTDVGLDIEILTGEDEARWGYAGALFGMEDVLDAAVIDIGGGSTEISFGDGKQFQRGVSLDIGAVRITERFFTTIPVPSETIEAARAAIRAELQRLEVQELPRELRGPFIAVAGTPTTLAAIHQGLDQFDPVKVQDYTLVREAVDQMLDMLLRTETARVLEHYPVVNKARADILPAGTLILQEAMEYLAAEEVRVSAHGLRYGIAMRELHM